MKKIFVLAIAISLFHFVKAQNKDSICTILLKFVDLADKNKLGDLKGTQIERGSDVKFYNSTMAFPGCVKNEIFDISNDGHYRLTASVSFKDEASMKALKKSMREKIQACLKASKLKFELNDNGDEYPVWWQCKKAKLSMESFSSAGYYSVTVRVENIHY